MREIKFRGRDMNRNWVYGLLTKKKVRNSGRASYAIATGDCSLAETIPVDEKTIGEFTGCKDKNGVEIYDGDMLVNVNAPEDVLTVYRDTGGWYVGVPVLVEGAGLYDGSITDNFDSSKYEVVGNIFEGEADERD